MSKTSKGFTAEERAAMKEHARELKAARKGAEAEKDVLAKIAEMSGSDRELAEKFHALVKQHAPSLASRTWYGMPAYSKDGSVVCFFQSAAKFKARYATIGFNDAAALDDGTLWATSFAVTAIGEAEEARLVELLERAVG